MKLYLNCLDKLENLRYFKLGFGGINIKRSNYSAKLKMF